MGVLVTLTFSPMSPSTLELETGRSEFKTSQDYIEDLVFASTGGRAPRTPGLLF